jgi:hypothetical protein
MVLKSLKPMFGIVEIIEKPLKGADAIFATSVPIV